MWLLGLGRVEGYQGGGSWGIGTVLGSLDPSQASLAASATEQGSSTLALRHSALGIAGGPAARPGGVCLGVGTGRGSGMQTWLPTLSDSQ